jgi:hypothetical protein
MRYICTSIVTTLALAGTALSDTVTVDDDGPADFNNIQAAVVSGADEILVYPGIYDGPGANNAVIWTNGASVTIRALGAPHETVIEGGIEQRGLMFENGETNDTVIDGFTIRWFSPSDAGGGVYLNNNSHPTIQNCIIENNNARRGGGIYCVGNSRPQILNCVIRYNRALVGNSPTGGGIYVGSGNPTISDCLIYANECTQMDGGGGGLHVHSNSGSTATISNTVFCSNIPNQTNGTWIDKGGNEIFDSCPDSDGDGVFDDIDNCDLANPNQEDCNSNGVGDVCDIAEGSSQDVDANGVPDDCQCLSDVDLSGVVDVADLLTVVAQWANTGPLGDVNYDGIVNTNDILAVIGNWGPCP